MAEFKREILIKKQKEDYFLSFLLASGLSLSINCISINYVTSVVVFFIVLIILSFLIYGYSLRKAIIEYREDILNIKYIGVYWHKEYNINLKEIIRYDEKKYSGISEGIIRFYKQDNSKITLFYNPTYYIDIRNVIVEVLNNYNNIEKKLSF